MLFDEINEIFRLHAENLSEACARYNTAKNLSSKKGVEKCMEEYRQAASKVLKARPFSRREKEAIALAAGQNLLVFPTIKIALSDEQLKSLFPEPGSSYTKKK
jgi:hypothetical protein